MLKKVAVHNIPKTEKSQFLVFLKNRTPYVELFSPSAS